MVDRKYRYYTIVNGYEREFFPFRNDNLQTTFTRQDGLRYTHTIDIADKISIRKEDYNYVYELETSANRCGEIGVRIDVLCGSEYIVFANGVLRLVDGDYDLDNCIIDIKITAVDPFYCYDYNKRKEIDIFEVKPFNQRIKVSAVEGEIETMESGATDLTDPYDPSFAGGVDPRSLGWVVYKSEFWSDGNDNPRGAPVQTEWRYYYAREVLTVSCNEYPEGWTEIENNCPSNKKLARAPIRVGYREIPIRFFNGAEGKTDFSSSTPRRFGEALEDDIKYAYDVMGLLDTPSDFDNGILWNDFITFFIEKFCGMPVRSNFFQINPDKTFNVAYPQLPNDGRTLNNVLFQKSDVKRLNASNNATKGLTALEKIVDDICTAYNLQYRIEDGYFNIEHVSYWEKVVELDLTTAEYARYMKGSNKYSYDQSELPQFEQFNMMESFNPDFKGTPIEYFGRCISENQDEKTKTFEVKTITTDVEYCIRYPDSDSKEVSDEGFVLMAAKKVGSNYILMRFNPILDSFSRANNPLSWSHLINAYYRHERPQKRGLMNNVFTDFFTTKPVKQQKPFSIKLCCDDQLKLDGLVKTGLGEGIIDKAILNHGTYKVELQLLYTNPYQEFFCVAPVSFTLNRTTNDRFYFDVKFLDCSVDHDVIIELTYPDNTTQQFPATSNCNQPLEFPLTGSAGELYKFRLKEVCADGESEWTPFLNVTYAEPVYCAPLPTVSYDRRTTQTTILFKFSGFVEEAVDVEVIYPNGSTRVLTNSFLRRSSSGSPITTVYVYLPTPFYTGAYKFRFRRRCDDTNVSSYGSTVNVML